MLMDNQTKQNIRIVLEYLWRDEERHYLESRERKKHIFHILKHLAKVVKYEP